MLFIYLQLKQMMHYIFKCVTKSSCMTYNSFAHNSFVFYSMLNATGYSESQHSCCLLSRLLLVTFICSSITLPENLIILPPIPSSYSTVTPIRHLLLLHVVCSLPMQEKEVPFVIVRPVTLLLRDYLCWTLGEAGGWGQSLSGCTMLGGTENE